MDVIWFEIKSMVMDVAEVELKAPEGIEVIFEGVESKKVIPKLAENLKTMDLKTMDLIDWNLEIWLGTFVSLFA